MKISDVGIDLIKRFEGLRLKKYDDGIGIMTIGYGHRILPRESYDEITESDADALLRKDLQTAENCVNNSVKGNITQSQFDALCSFTFNLGCGALGKSTLLRYVNDGNDMSAAQEFGKWVNGGGKPMPGLVKRRQAEMELFLS